MKLVSVLTLASAFSVEALVDNPINKVTQMLGDLQAKIISEGEQAQKLYEEYSEWCEDRSRTLGHEIVTGKAEVEALKATIQQRVSMGGSLTEKIEQLSGSLAIDEADRSAAVAIRSKEAAVFAAAEKELLEVIDTLERAIRILEREMRKGGASMMQLHSAGNVAQALSALVQAAAISSADSAKLASFVQSQQESDELGAPAGAVYKSQSAGVVETLENLLDTAQNQLEDTRQKETANLHNFEMLKQSLDDEIKFASQEFDNAKKSLASSAEGKSVATGNLGVTTKELAADEEAKAQLHHECMRKAEDFEAETKSRGEELKALAEAKKVILESTNGAASIKYDLVQETSLLQVARSQLGSGVDLANFEAVRLIRDLARSQKAPALAQLAQRMEAVMRLGTAADPFSKVKGLIRDMIMKLESEAGADATKKAWCDRQLADTNEKKSNKNSEIDKLTTKIDSMSARSAQLKEEIAELQSSLAKLAASQASMNNMRSEEHAAFIANKADMEKGLEGVKMALKILTEYYSSENQAHSAAVGAGEGIIGLLEVVESDFSKGFAEISSAEESAVAAYEQQSKENEIEKTTKEQSVTYKAKEAKTLDVTVADLSSDRSTVHTELDATLFYLSRIEDQCIAKAETYSTRRARFEAEIAGLKDALQILESETALLQQQSEYHHAQRHSFHVAV